MNPHRVVLRAAEALDQCPTSLPIRRHPPVIPLFAESDSGDLNQLILISPATHGVAEGRPGNPRRLTKRDAVRLLQFRCRFAAPKEQKPKVSAANRARLLQISCRFSKAARPGQGFRFSRRAALRCMQQEQQGAICPVRRPGSQPGNAAAPVAAIGRSRS
jgi:hypothetical protein